MAMRLRPLGVVWLALFASHSVACDDAPTCDATYQTPAVFDEGLALELTAAAEDGLPLSRAPGATLTVHMPGMGTFATGAGFRDVAAQLPMQPRQRLRIGSITKTFHTATMLTLVESGVLGLEDRASDWVTIEGLGRDITVRQLLSHQAGIHNYTDDASFLGHSMTYWEPAEVIEWSLAHDAPYAPGETYHYSNTGFFITGLVMEAATGQPFHALIREHTLRPLALDDTSEETGEGRDCAMSEGYVVTPANRATDLIDMSWAWAAGGMVSSGVDLCRWAEAVYRGDLLSPTSRAAMIGPDLGAGGVDHGYGLGTQHTTRGGVRVVGHTGSTMGFKGEVFIHLESGACVAVLTNEFTSEPTAISRPAWEAVASRLATP